MTSTPQPATAARQAANQFLDAQYADGSTDIHQALLIALQGGMGESTARIVVLLTDGQPTAGETNPTQIVNAVSAANTSHARLFTFGIGCLRTRTRLRVVVPTSSGTCGYRAAGRGAKGGDMRVVLYAEGAGEEGTAARKAGVRLIAGRVQGELRALGLSSPSRCAPGARSTQS